MRKFGFSFWLIGMAQTFLGLLVGAPVLLAGAWLSSYFEPAILIGLLGAILMFFVAQWPIWLAMGAQVVERKGALSSLLLALRASIRAPFGGLFALACIAMLFIIPLPMLVFYPVYFYFFFAPLTAVFGVMYYQAASGLIK